MRDDFCAFVLTHGRPEKVYTVPTLLNAGYTGKIYIVIDDEDDAGDEYRAAYPDQVLCFSKAAMAKQFDEGDNFGDRRTIVYARNACFQLAREVGCRYFIQLDDDYSGLYYRFNDDGVYGTYPIHATFDGLIDALIEFYQVSGAQTVAISQGGDHIGGGDGQTRRLLRKAMNTFICDTANPFWFVGRINEDVNTYTSAARAGALFFTAMQAQVNQKATQSNAGGMTEIYNHSGTYVKSFYSVMYCPSSVKISTLQDERSPHPRIHHSVDWEHTAPKIIRAPAPHD